MASNTQVKKKKDARKGVKAGLKRKKQINRDGSTLSAERLFEVRES